MMMIMNAVLPVAEAISRCSAPELRTALFACDGFLLDYDEYPDELLQEWLKLLCGRAYDECPKSWLVLQHLYDNSQLLTEIQKATLVPVIASKFAAGNEKQSFIIATLLGEVCGAVTTLMRLTEEYKDHPLGDIARDVLMRTQRKAKGKP
jgi:hypothetical protein